MTDTPLSIIVSKSSPSSGQFWAFVIILCLRPVGDLEQTLIHPMRV